VPLGAFCFMFAAWPCVPGFRWLVWPCVPGFPWLVWPSVPAFTAVPGAFVGLLVDTFGPEAPGFVLVWSWFCADAVAIVLTAKRAAVPITMMILLGGISNSIFLLGQPTHGHFKLPMGL